MAHSPDIIMKDVNTPRTATFQSNTSQPQMEANNAVIPIYQWTSDRDTDLGDMNAGLYQLSPSTRDEPFYNIILYMEAFSFFDLYGFRDAKDEIIKITDCFAKVIPSVLPNACVQLLWSRTMSDFSLTVEEEIKVTPSKLGSLKAEEYISRKPSVYIIMSPNYFARKWFGQWFGHDTLLRQKLLQQAREFFFIVTAHPKLSETVSDIVQKLDKSMHKRRTIDCTAFKWNEERNGERCEKLKVIKMPSPSVSQTPSRSSSSSPSQLSNRSISFTSKRARTMERSVGSPFSNPSYSWLGYILLPTSTTPPCLSPTEDEWMRESARLFSKFLRKTDNMILGHGFSLWFLVTPLESWNLGPSANVSFFSHWGILISKSTRWDLENLIGNSTTNLMESLGDVHELRNNHGITVYKPRTFYMKNFQVASKLKYLGQTGLDMNDMYAYGLSLLSDDRKYDMIKNNCQGWVENFLKYVCPDHAGIDRTIADRLFMPNQSKS